MALSLLSLFSSPTALSEETITVVGDRVDRCPIGQVVVGAEEGSYRCEDYGDLMGSLNQLMADNLNVALGGMTQAFIDTFNDSNTGKTDCGEGNPIDLATQNKTQTEVDFRGFGQLPLVVSRQYNSRGNGIGHFGNNWSTNLGSYLAWSTRQRNGQPVVEVKLFQSDGRVIKMTFDDATKEWKRDSGQVESLIKDSNDHWLYLNGDVEEVYENSGRLLYVRSGNGEVIYYHYDSDTSTKVTQLEHSSGQTINFIWSGHRIIQIKDPANQIYTYDYDASGNLLSVTYPSLSGSTKKQYIYSGTRLTRIIDENGDAYASWEYDSSGKATRSYHGDEQESVTIVASGVEAGGRYTRSRNAHGKETTYHFVDVGGQWKIRQVQGHAKGSCYSAHKNTSYDANGFVNTKTDWAGNLTDYDYDAYGNLLKVIEGKGTAYERTTEYQWHSILNKPLEIKTDLLKTEFVYSDNGLLEEKRETNLVNHITRSTRVTYTFHDNGLVKKKAINGPRTGVADTLELFYSSTGFLTSMKNALGHWTTFANHNQFGSPGKITYPDGRVDTFTYHPRGWLLTENKDINGDKRTTIYSYDKAGQLESVTRADGSKLTMTYDSAHRLTKVTDLNNDSKEYLYDVASNLTQERIRGWITKLVPCSGGGFGGGNGFEMCTETTEETLKATKRTYDELNRLKSIIEGSGQQLNEFGWPDGAFSEGKVVQHYGYNTNNQPTQVLDGKSNGSTHHYGALGRVGKIIDRNGGETSYWYNVHDQIVRIRDPKGLNTFYDYDGFGHLKHITSPDTGLTTLRYDLAGNLILKIDAKGITSRWTYDELNRMKTETIGDITRTYTYDLAHPGRLYRIRDEAGTHTLTFNAHGELIRKASSLAGLSMTQWWAYNKVGQVKSMTYPNGEKVTYDFNNLGQTSTIKVGNSTLVQEVNYKPFGPVFSIKFGNGAQLFSDRDNRYRLRGKSSSSTSGTVMDLDYYYDLNGNITKINDAKASTTTKTRTFSYDTLNRITYSNDYGASYTYGYDANGNRTHKGSTPYQIATDSNRLMSYASINVQYDDNGNIKQKGSATYTYNDANRLIGYSKGSTSATYTYNSVGQRVSKKVGSTITYFGYDLDGKLIYERTGSNHIAYIYLNNQLVGVSKNNDLYYVHTDHQGRPEVMTNNSNTVVWKAKNWAFDRNVDYSVIGYVNLGFPGQYYDEEKQSWYNYFRDYDAELGRYLQSDPIGLAAGQFSTYQYVDSNPVRFVDPFGLKSCSCSGWDKFKKEFKSSWDSVDSVIDNHNPVPAIQPDTAASFLLGGPAAKSYNGSTIVQETIRYTRGRINAPRSQFKAYPRFGWSTVAKTTAINRSAASLSWYAGRAVGATVNSAYNLAVYGGDCE